MNSQSDPDTPADPDYLPFADGPYRMTMGLMALKPADWIEIGSRYAEEIALRKSLLESRRDEVLAALPGSEAACREVLDQLAGFLPERFPDRFERDGTGLVNRVSGDRRAIGRSTHFPNPGR